MHDSREKKFEGNNCQYVIKLEEIFYTSIILLIVGFSFLYTNQMTQEVMT